MLSDKQDAVFKIWDSQISDTENLPVHKYSKMWQAKKKQACYHIVVWDMGPYVPWWRQDQDARGSSIPEEGPEE